MRVAGYVERRYERIRVWLSPRSAFGIVIATRLDTEQIAIIVWRHNHHIPAQLGPTRVAYPAIACILRTRLAIMNQMGMEAIALLIRRLSYSAGDERVRWRCPDSQLFLSLIQPGRREQKQRGTATAGSR